MTEKTTPRAGVKRLIGIDFDFGALRTAGPRYWAFVYWLYQPLTYALYSGA